MRIRLGIPEEIEQRVLYTDDAEVYATIMRGGEAPVYRYHVQYEENRQHFLNDE